MYTKTDRNVTLYLCFLFQPFTPLPPNTKTDSIIGLYGYCFTHQNIRIDTGAVEAVIEWQLDLQLPVQSVPIATKGVSSNPVHGEVYSVKHYVIKFVSELRHKLVVFSGTPVSSTNKADCHDIAEILLKVALNIITKQTRKQQNK